MSLTSGSVPTWGDGGGHLELIAMLRRQVSDRLAATGRRELANADRDQADGFHAWLDDYARQAAAGADVSRRLAKPGRDDP